jgi:adenosylhomocysteine nucleosidase
MAIADEAPVRLVVAAESREFRGILRSCGPVTQLAWPVQYAVAAEFAGARYIFAANGPGPRLAAEVLCAAEKNSAKAGIQAVISTGFCGGLDPQLRLGSIVNATSVIDGSSGCRWVTVANSTNTSCVRGSILSIDRVAVTAEEKRELAASTGAIAVEMEAAAVCSWAQANKIPFHCVRVVSDTAEDNLAIDMNAMRDADGRFDRLRIALTALAGPFSRIPGLMQLNRNCRLAEERLGSFFAHCRFE